MPAYPTARTSCLLLCLALVSSVGIARAQTLDEGVVMPSRALGVGVMYSSDRWSEYWEGTLKRSNENIGTLTTRMVTSVIAYGVNDRLSVTAVLPWVQTRASQGSLHGMDGVQDFGLIARYRLLTTPFTEHASLSAIAIGAAAVPATRYTPDFLPLSIGSASRRVTGRMLLDLQSRSWWYASASAAYTARKNVTLDRSAYYTDGQLYLTSEVEMPDVTDYGISAGYRVGRLTVPLHLMRQRTLGGGDIRRQDMPFVSNRMDFTKAGASVMYTLAVPEGTMLELGAMRTLRGRNVGQSTTVMAGVVFCYNFKRGMAR